jgi:hypothetical protein
MLYWYEFDSAIMNRGVKVSDEAEGMRVHKVENQQIVSSQFVPDWGKAQEVIADWINRGV